MIPLASIDIRCNSYGFFLLEIQYEFLFTVVFPDENSLWMSRPFEKIAIFWLGIQTKSTVKNDVTKEMTEMVKGKDVESDKKNELNRDKSKLYGKMID
jgi:hypothetical protein